MGEVITRKAAVDDIMSDVAATLVNTTARGGVVQSEAEEYLRLPLSLYGDFSADLKKCETALTPLVKSAEFCDQDADALLSAGHDELWNILGRPGRGSDIVYEVMWPNGASTYTKGAIAEQPFVMELLATLLDRQLHSDIPEERSKAMALDIRASAERLHAAVEATRLPKVRCTYLTKAKQAVARAAQVQLARLKRRWKARGMSEADIHQFIPDRPTKKPTTSR